MTSLLYENDPADSPAVEYIWDTFLLRMRGCVSRYRFLLDCQPAPGRPGGWRSVAGGCGSESGFNNTTFYLSHRIIQLSTSQMKRKLSIFSGSHICHDISQKWYLNNHVVKSCFHKNSFHIQFYIMRTFPKCIGPY